MYEITIGDPALGVAILTPGLYVSDHHGIHAPEIAYDLLTSFTPLDPRADSMKYDPRELDDDDDTWSDVWDDILDLLNEITTGGRWEWFEGALFLDADKETVEVCSDCTDALLDLDERCQVPEAERSVAAFHQFHTVYGLVDEIEAFFSWVPCDVCQRREGGMRHTFHVASRPD